MGASVDPVTNQRVVKCLNKKGSCRRNICECDNEFGRQLQAASSKNQWNEENSHFGGFDQRQKCLARIGGGGGMGGINNEKCCGYTLTDLLTMQTRINVVKDKLKTMDPVKLNDDP